MARLKKSKRGVGRPTDYRPEFCETAARHYGAGATDIQVADALGVHVSTLYRWQHDHPGFREAAKASKDIADDRVERALYARAVGYEFDSVKIMQNNGAPVIVPFREHVPPDPGAAVNWLKNRRPDQWRDRIDINATVKPADVTAEPLPANEWDQKFGARAN